MTPKKLSNPQSDPSSREEFPLCCKPCPEVNTAKHPYRVFISYSHQDRALAKRLGKHLTEKGLFPITDHEIRVGEAFSEEIRDMIECSHVFMPLVTPSANKRLWVQQEIGYAAALHVPVCPIAVGKLPSGMAENIQGIHIAEENAKRPSDDAVMAVVKGRLNYGMIDDLVRRARLKPRQGRYDCALVWNERQELLVALTDAAFRGGCKLFRRPRKADPLDRRVWRLRQCTAFGSFSIPDAAPDNPQWYCRDSAHYRSQHERRLLRRERQVMDAYVKCFGCDLIMDPRINIHKLMATDGVDPNAATASSVAKGNADLTRAATRIAQRVVLIIDFIKSHLKDEQVRVVIPAKEEKLSTNLIIVGDWFAAEAVVPLYAGGGYERTMFTRHAPTVLNLTDRFNQEFNDHMRDTRCKTPKESKERSLKILFDQLKSFKKKYGISRAKLFPIVREG